MSTHLKEQGKAMLKGKENVVLLLVIREFGTKAFGLRDLERYAEMEGIAGAELYGIVYRLWSRRILSAMQTGWEEMQFSIPQEKLSFWLGWLVPELGAPACLAVSESERPCTSDHCKGIDAAFFVILVYTARNRLKLTAKRTLAQKERTKLQALIKRCLPAAGELGDCAKNEDSEKDLVQFVIESALDLGVLELENNWVTPNEERLRHWLSLSVGNMRDRLYVLWRKKFLPVEPPLRLAAAALENIPAGRWTTPGTILDSLVKYGILKTDIREVYPEWTIRWVTALFELGLVEISNLPEAELALRRPDFGTYSAVGNAPIWFVQPDLDIILTGGISFALRWDLECFAERRNTEPLEIYTLSREAFRIAWLNGRTAHACLNFLGLYAMEPIPVLVGTALKDWELEFAKAYEAKVIPDGNVQKRTESAHYPAFSVIFRGKSTESAVSVLRERRESRILERGSKLPLPETVWKACGTVPSIWLKQARNYHDSTKKELVHKAIEWKTVLRLKKDEAERLVIPKRLAEDGITWRLHGIERGVSIDLGPADWEEMQIVHPASLPDLTCPIRKGSDAL